MAMFTWQAVSAIVAVLALLGSTMLIVMKSLIKGQLADQSTGDREYTDRKLDGLMASITETMDEFKNLEKQFLIFKAELPKEYVRREDWIRFISTIDAKLDTLNERQTNSNLQFAKLNETVEAFMHQKEST